MFAKLATPHNTKYLRVSLPQLISPRGSVYLRRLWVFTTLLVSNRFELSIKYHWGIKINKFVVYARADMWHLIKIMIWKEHTLVSSSCLDPRSLRWLLYHRCPPLYRLWCFARWPCRPGKTHEASLGQHRCPQKLEELPAHWPPPAEVAKKHKYI